MITMSVTYKKPLRLFGIIAICLLVPFRGGQSTWTTTASPSSSSISSLSTSSITDADAHASPIVTLTDSTFDEILESSDSLLVLFKANKCPHCKRMAPAYDLLSQDEDLKSHGVTVASIDVPTNRGSSIRFGIRGFPSLVYFRNGSMYRYKGKRQYTLIKSFVLKGYENMGDGETIPPKPTFLSQFGLIGKAIWIELYDAALGKSGMAGYAIVVLMGLLIGLLGFTIVFIAVLIRSGGVGGSVDDDDNDLKTVSPKTQPNTVL